MASPLPSAAAATATRAEAYGVIMGVMHLDGSSDPLRLEDLPGLVDELEDADDEHPDVAVGERYGWSVDAYASGLVVLTHAERPHDELVLHDVARSEVLAMFTELATGEIDALRARPWVVDRRS